MRRSKAWKSPHVRTAATDTKHRGETCESFCSPGHPRCPRRQYSGAMDAASDAWHGDVGEFVPAGFDPPTSLITTQFILEPLGPEHNEADHAAWMSSIQHIRATPGYPDPIGDWPPPEGMTLDENLVDLVRHAEDFAAARGFTFTVLDRDDRQVIGCCYLYPPEAGGDVIVQSWVRADRAEQDEPLAEAIAEWLTVAWPWNTPDRCGRH